MLVFRGVSLSRKTWELFFGTVTDHSICQVPMPQKSMKKSPLEFFGDFRWGSSKLEKKNLNGKKNAAKNHGFGFLLDQSPDVLTFDLLIFGWVEVKFPTFFFMFHL